MLVQDSLSDETFKCVLGAVQVLHLFVVRAHVGLHALELSQELLLVLI